MNLTAREYCQRFYSWIEYVDAIEASVPGFKVALPKVRLAIEKSCLLDRMIYGGEQPSQTPCPVHKGHWSGISMWPGDVWHVIQGGGTRPVLPVEFGERSLQAVYDGCRCFTHKSCNCTTGWQPDEHCGCLPKSDAQS